MPDRYGNCLTCGKRVKLRRDDKPHTHLRQPTEQELADAAPDMPETEACWGSLREVTG